MRLKVATFDYLRRCRETDDESLERPDAWLSGCRRRRSETAGGTASLDVLYSQTAAASTD